MSIRTLASVERELIIDALEECNGDRVEASRQLGIGKTTMYRKLREWGIESRGVSIRRGRGEAVVNENQDIG